MLFGCGNEVHRGFAVCRGRFGPEHFQSVLDSEHCELVCVLIYIVPRTSIVGAILLTGFLGGAIASHARIESPLFTHTLFGTYVGLMIWGGLILRNSTLRALIRNSAAGRDARWA